ncbi:hypothetical protein F0P96_04485 [Hymenobacter busanensis]|uniref:Uncharacterized protein n=1 Tax=Hymenobacter busanensis TaxID=2607656 RepID=A0A7L4ZTU4_9BACT|nr:hypothetical protein [Hymenobacter busanensis]KAA9339880.1 hypothetical protein F0P96_04485 [Hymenobacter busanensis]QHJ06363.1 hypothetical protein GUY19_03240 [Hymenobacter busanensis]
MMFEFRLLRRWLPILVAAVAISSCRTCPMASCHVRKVHFHNGKKYRGQPLFKKQNPEIGEKFKVHGQPDGKMHNNRAKGKP